MAVPDDVWTYARDVGARLTETFGESLTGVYLHGSGAMGGWAPERSDVDILAVITRSATVEEKDKVAGALAHPQCVAPGAGLEFSLVARPSFEPLTESPPFELHIATGADPKVVDGASHKGDPDLILHYAVCRERGLAIVGPVPESSFPEVPRAMVLAQLRAELKWACKHAPPRYVVLNACRAWAFAESGQVLSKLEGALWSMQKEHFPALAEQALRAQAGGREPADEGGIAELVRAALQALASAAADNLTAGESAP